MAVGSQQRAFGKFERDSVRVPDSKNREAKKKAHPEIWGALEG